MVKKVVLNDYIKLMLESRKKGLESFQYKDNTYIKIVSEKTGMIMYKKQTPNSCKVEKKCPCSPKKTKNKKSRKPNKKK